MKRRTKKKQRPILTVEDAGLKHSAAWQTWDALKDRPLSDEYARACRALGRAEEDLSRAIRAVGKK